MARKLKLKLKKMMLTIKIAFKKAFRGLKMKKLFDVIRIYKLKPADVAENSLKSHVVHMSASTLQAKNQASAVNS